MVNDEQLKQHIVDHLKNDSRVDISKLDIIVKNGNVGVEGSTDSAPVRRAIERDIWVINGVKDVKNNVVVEVLSPPEIPKDDIIETRITNIITWHSGIAPDDVNVKVEDAWVNLTGSVENLFEKWLIEERALDVRGVKGVTNEIAVVPTENIADEIIAQKIVDKLERNKFLNVDDITVVIEDGEVSLKGNVRNKMAHDAAFDSALFTLGVKSIENDLIIENPL